MNKTAEFFKEITKIPRASGKEEKIADYLCEFAKSRGLECFRDDIHNVIIKKDNGSKKTIILQGHTDMVCVAEKNLPKNFDEEGIEWWVDGDFIKAKGTSLGADNGIGVAVILSVLDENIKGFPNIEAVFTVQEETTMAGAENLDYSKLKGKMLLSLDGDREGVLEVSSAGMCTVNLTKKLRELKEPKGINIYNIEVDGLMGGHSGDDIHRNRLNAIEIMGRILKEIDPFGIVSLFGGERVNVIPSSASCTFASTKSAGEISYICSKYRELVEENGKSPNIMSSVLEKVDWKVYREDDIVNFIYEFAHGVNKADKNGFPIISQNMGMIRFAGGVVEMTTSMRSSDKKLETSSLEKLQKLAEKYGIKYKLLVKNPFFAYNSKSKLRKSLHEAYHKLYGKEAKERHIHACVEAGVMAGHISGLDVCVIAPEIYDLHSVNERVSVSSISRVYEWVVETLLNL